MAWRNLIEGHQEIMQQNKLEIGNVYFQRRRFLTFYYSHIRQNSCASWWLHFSTNQHGLQGSNRGSSKEHFDKIIWKSDRYFWRRRFITIAMKGKTVLPPGGHVFRQINVAWVNLIEGHPMGTSTKLFENRPTNLGEESFKSLFLLIVMETRIVHVWRMMHNAWQTRGDHNNSPCEHFVLRWAKKLGNVLCTLSPTLQRMDHFLDAWN